MFILKGIGIGMFVCIPVGPLGFLSIQRTIKEGRMIGFLSGVGAALSDLIYSSIAIFGMRCIDQVLEKYNRLIMGSTGVLFLIIGLYLIINSEKNDKTIKDIIEGKRKKDQVINTMASTFFMGLSNPMTFLIFLAVFTRVGICVKATEFTKNISFAFSIFLGSCLLWIIVTNIVKLFQRVFELRNIIIIDKVIGTVISIFGIFNLLKVIIIKA